MILVDTPGHDDTAAADIDTVAAREKLGELAADLHSKIKALGKVHASKGGTTRTPTADSNPHSWPQTFTPKSRRSAKCTQVREGRLEPPQLAADLQSKIKALGKVHASKFREDSNPNPNLHSKIKALGKVHASKLVDNRTITITLTLTCTRRSRR